MIRERILNIIFIFLAGIMPVQISSVTVVFHSLFRSPVTELPVLIRQKRRRLILFTGILHLYNLREFINFRKRISEWFSLMFVDTIDCLLTAIYDIFLHPPVYYMFFSSYYPKESDYDSIVF